MAAHAGKDPTRFAAPSPIPPRWYSNGFAPLSTLSRMTKTQGIVVDGDPLARLGIIPWLISLTEEIDPEECTIGETLTRARSRS